MPEQHRDHEVMTHPSRIKELGMMMLDAARDLVGFSPFVLPDAKSCVVPVAGRDPFSPSPNLSPERRFELAPINDGERVELMRRLKR